MRALVQRVAGASVSVEGDAANIGGGLVVFVGVARDDDEADARYIVEKVANLRVFEDDDGRFNISALDASAELLVVSQFTLYADVRRGRRPSFTEAAAPEDAQPLFERTVELFRETGLRVETGRFQARMMVELRNDGPVTLMVDSAERHRPRRG